jgi:hypothetical protein
MKPQNIDYLRKNSRIEQSLLDSFLTSMPMVIMVYMPAILFTYVHFSGGWAKGAGGIGVPIFFWIIAILMFFQYRKKLKLQPVHENISSLNARNIILKALKTLKWDHNQISENEIVAFVPVSLFSWGEIVRVLYFDEKIFANSIGRTAPITFGKDRRNIRRLKDEISKIIQEDSQ